MTPKFIFIVACFAIAVLSYFLRNSNKDWAWLTAGLMFTVGADYFLVIHNNHLPGVAVFCFAHVSYILRGLGASKRASKAALLSVPFLALFVFLAFINDALLVLAGIYTVLFLINIAVNTWHFTQKNTPLPKSNKTLVLAGLILFALCDINVALFNMPRQFGTPVIFPWAFHMIWIFYLPSQLLLAVSGIAFPKAKE
ncbi:MAG: lysoplasmalogenase family protein [Firmicutes bacterium]|nr:lysoplasmalogenase family protein [Bacillota bacterium]